MKPATFNQAFQVLQFVKDQGLGSPHVQALIKTGLFADLCAAAREGSLVHVGRHAFREFLGLSLEDFPVCSTVIVDYDRQLPEIIQAGEYDLVNTDITPEHFPISGEGKHKVSIALWHFGREVTYDEILAKMSQHGYRPATIVELLAFGRSFPGHKISGYQIIALGSIWKAPWPSGPLAPFIQGRADVWKLDLYYELESYTLDMERNEENWGFWCRFLAVRK